MIFDHASPADMGAGWIECRLPTAAGTYGTAAEHAAALSAAIGQLAHYWAKLAYRGSEPVPPARIENARAIVAWAQNVLSLADDDEGGMAPEATVRVLRAHEWARPGDVPPITRVLLGWSGTWTPGRWVVVELLFDDHFTLARPPVAARLSWCSGTGTESSFLDIRGLAAAVEDTGACPGGSWGHTPDSIEQEVFHENISEEEEIA